MYEIAFEEADRFLVFTLKGFWNADILMSYRKDMAKFVMSLPRDKPFGILSDTTEFSIQSTEIVEAFRQLTQQADAMSPMPIPNAIIVSGTLAKLQAERIFDLDENRAIFTSVSEARTWLRERMKGR